MTRKSPAAAPAAPAVAPVAPHALPQGGGSFVLRDGVPVPEDPAPEDAAPQAADPALPAPDQTPV